MAPVRGITDIIYRNVFHKHFSGIDTAITPFITTVHGDQIKSSQKEEFISNDNLIPIIPQIIGKSPSNFITLAKTVFDLGNAEANWNLGCPYPTMTKKRCGAGLIAHADLVDQFLDTVCSAIPNRISIKVRLGLLNRDELENLIPLFNRYPITEITIHPRTGKQMYGGVVDLEMFELYKEQLLIPVIYNGDITTLDHFQKLKARFPNLNKWMLGRGLFSNPMLAQEIKRGVCTDAAERTERIIKFSDELLCCYRKRLSGDTHLMQKMVAHWEYLHQCFPQGKKIYKQLKKSLTTNLH